MRAYGRQRVNAFRPVHDVDARSADPASRTQRIAIRLARVDDRRRLVQHVGREELIAEHAAAPANATPIPSRLQSHERLAPIARPAAFPLFVGLYSFRTRHCAHQRIGFHRDHAHRTALRAKAAADAARFILEHGRAGDDAQFLGGHVVQFHPKDCAFACESVPALPAGNSILFERHQLNAVLRADIHAAAAEDALRSVRLRCLRKPC